ncbi:minor tail protein [Arthrobacter phage Berka]|nr:minor tail protein [Arthrobacter phage Berka]
MAQTPGKAWPYAGPNDVPDVPYWQQRLAEKGDAVQVALEGRLEPLELDRPQAGAVTVSVTSGTAAGAVNVTFPQAFSAVPNVVLTKASVSGSASTMRRLQPVVSAITAAGFTANLETADGTNVGATFAVSCQWIAL